MNRNNIRHLSFALLALLPLQLIAANPPWRTVLSDRVALFGHRNYICIVDSAYPAQTQPGVETIVTGENQLEVVRAVLGALATAPHVRPVVLLDKELSAVPEADAKGISEYRDALEKTIRGLPVERILHEDVIRELDKSGSLVRVLILKTTLTLPYTSVFLRLECGYWSEDAERRLRKNIPAR